MALEIIVKANDGRGMGHILRILNFVNYDFFGDSVKVLAHAGFSGMLGQLSKRMNLGLVEDKKYRVNLDFNPGQNIYFKEGNTNFNQNGLKVDSDVINALVNYYFSVTDNADSNTKLIYIDDQNAPESVFTERIAKVIGVKNPGTLRSNAPNAKIAFEIETQIWDRVGIYAIGETRRECFDEVDYVHLSSDIDFFKKVIGNYKFTNYQQKIIPMGFPLASWIMDIFDGYRADENKRAKAKKDTLSKVSESEDKNFVYCTFGGGAGAEELLEMLVEVAGKRKDCVFGLTDGKGDFEKELAKKGYEIEVHDEFKRVKSKDGSGYLVLMKGVGQKEHLEKVACADALLQGTGSGSTYESIRAARPMIALPLNRPGYEQVIKGLGVEMFGGGKVLYLKSVQDQVKSLVQMAAQYGHNLEGIGEACTTNSLSEAVEYALSNKQKCIKNLTDLNTKMCCFADPLKTADSLKMMAAGAEVSTIIRRCGLKSPYGIN
jgi:hypothetical protein